MQRTLKAPPKLTNDEQRKLDRFIWMADWHFEKMIKPSCTILSSFVIHWTGKGNDYNSVEAVVYGLRVVRSKTDEPCIANFFVHYETQVYQVTNIEDAVHIVQLLKKEHEYDQYENKVWRAKLEEKKKLEKQMSKQNGKIRKLRVVKKKAA